MIDRVHNRKKSMSSIQIFASQMHQAETDFVCGKFNHALHATQSILRGLMLLLENQEDVPVDICAVNKTWNCDHDSVINNGIDRSPSGRFIEMKLFGDNYPLVRVDLSCVPDEILNEDREICVIKYLVVRAAGLMLQAMHELKLSTEIVMEFIENYIIKCMINQKIDGVSFDFVVLWMQHCLMSYQQRSDNQQFSSIINKNIQSSNALYLLSAGTIFNCIRPRQKNKSYEGLLGIQELFCLVISYVLPFVHGVHRNEYINNFQQILNIDIDAEERTLMIWKKGVTVKENCCFQSLPYLKMFLSRIEVIDCITIKVLKYCEMELNGLKYRFEKNSRSAIDNLTREHRESFQEGTLTETQSHHKSLIVYDIMEKICSWKRSIDSKGKICYPGMIIILALVAAKYHFIVKKGISKVPRRNSKRTILSSLLNEIHDIYIGKNKSR